MSALDAENLRRNGSNGGERLTTEIALSLGPISNWNQLEPSEHLAQFYETDSFLLSSLSEFVVAGLNAGETVVVVATQPHHEQLDKLILNNGVDPIQATASGKYVPLDAETQLQRFMVDKEPDGHLFREALSPIVSRRLQGARMRVFGEMVALLWQSGNIKGAIQLEQLWNELLQDNSFVLYCAYPMSCFGETALAQPLMDVCAAHSRVIPAESYTGLTTDESRQRAILELQQKARVLEAEILERTRAEEKLQALAVELELQVSREQLAREDAERANRMKDEFLATVSHELRTPLNAIIGWLHMLKTGSLDEALSKRALETIDRNAKAQAQLVDDILDVARVITGKLRFKLAQVDISTIIRAAVQSVELAANAKGIRVEATLDPTASCLTGDAGRLEQVIWNLLSNAIKFTPTGGKVEVHTYQIGTAIQIHVRDTGVGIKDEFLPFIFDRFSQADGTTTRRHGGLGLGLAIVRHFVELHGGTVHAASAGPGLGSTFTITLPTSAQLPYLQ